MTLSEFLFYQSEISEKNKKIIQNLIDEGVSSKEVKKKEDFFTNFRRDELNRFLKNLSNRDIHHI